MARINQEEFAARAKERSSIYGLLSFIYSKEPGQELIKKFRDSNFLQLLKKLGIELGEDFRRGSLEEAVEELAVEYTRLFIGPGRHIYPYESAYRHDNADMLPVTAAQIENLVKSHGLGFRPEFHDTFDHISIELEFMEKLTYGEARAWDKRNCHKAVELLTLERQFVDEHLAKWIPEFSDKVVKGALLSFYREIAKLTEEYVLLETREIKDLIKRARA